MKRKKKEEEDPSASAVTEKEGSPAETIEKGSQPSSKKGSILIFGIAGLLLLMGAIGTAGYLGFVPIPGLSHGKKPQLPVKEKQETGPILKLPPLVINLKEEGGRSYVKTTIVLEIAQKNGVEEVQSRIPLMTDMLILTLSDKRLEDLRRPGSKELLKEELLTKMNQHLGSDRIKRIYFDEFLYQ